MSAEAPTHAFTRWVFLRLLGVVYLIAFLSLWVQIDGLIGSEGILPLGEHLDRVREAIGSAGYWRLPTLCWLNDSDAFLHLLCGAGTLLSILVIVGVAPVPVLFATWAVYLSLVQAGQIFLNFQWDVLLLETGFCTLLFAPRQWGPRWPWNEAEPHRGGLWALRFLLFKLMFLSGAVKLLVMDETWWGLTALDYHYWTQPLPLWTAWYAHHLPGWFQKLSVFLMFVIELGVPFLIFFGRRLRLAACAALIFLQLLIAATGNYTFFNLLTIVLCVPLLDDRFLVRLLPGALRTKQGSGPFRPRGRISQAVAGALVAVLLFLSGLTFVRSIVRTGPPGGFDGVVGRLFEVTDRAILSWAQPGLLRWTDPFHSISGYGLFRTMTTERPEIVIQGSDDGRSWQEYEFRWKPGDVSRRPGLVAPHQPRLDWQMWFAALNPPRAYGWLERLLMRLLQGSPEVRALLDDEPFAERPPRFVRLVYYQYEFASPEQRRSTGAWWTRRLVRPLSRPFSLRDFE